MIIDIPDNARRFSTDGASLSRVRYLLANCSSWQNCESRHWENINRESVGITRD